MKLSELAEKTFSVIERGDAGLEIESAAGEHEIYAADRRNKGERDLPERKY
jgi:hypothetical protein